jgi:hypothetical protein
LRRAVGKAGRPATGKESIVAGRRVMSKATSRDYRPERKLCGNAWSRMTPRHDL